MVIQFCCLLENEATLYMLCPTPEVHNIKEYSQSCIEESKQAGNIWQYRQHETQHNKSQK